MIIKYITFLVGIIWSYAIIKTQSVFSKKAGIIFKIFITKISWLSLIAACYFGYKNFTVKSTVIGIIWSYSIIKTQSVFSKKAGIIFKIFITKISWLSLIAACYFGYKNFTVKSTVIGIIIGVLLVNVGFYLLKKYINQRFNEKQLTFFKSFFEYTLIFLVIYFVLF